MPADSAGASSRTPAALRGALLGARAGALAAVLDIASTILWLSDPADQLRLAIALLAIGAAAGAVIGCIVGFALGEHLASNAPVRAHAARLAWFVAPALAPVAWLLFSGGAMRRLPMLPVLRSVAWLLLTVIGSVALAVVVRAVHLARVRSGPARALTAAGFITTAMLLHAVDHRFMPRLYEYLHIGVAVAMAVALAAALSVLLPPRASLQRTSATVLFAATLVSLGLAWRALEGWDNVRAEVFGVHAPFVRHVALGISALTTARQAEMQRDEGERRARFARERSRATVPTGSLPRATGAHVLLITIDALRSDRVGRVVGGASLTPALDALAARGVRFEHAYAQAPHSSYSISSLHTSEYLHETVPLGQSQPIATLADVLARRGYHTVGLFTNGIFFTEGERLLAYRERGYGFRRTDHVDRRADAQTDLAMREIDDVVRRGEPPTLFWIHYFDTHEPYAGSGRTSVERYDAAVRSVDGSVGRLLAHAGQRFAREMVIALTADHGEEFGEHGGVYHGSTLYEEQVRVPLILVAPGLAPARVAAPVELIDVAPTLLASVGIESPASMRGRDARALARDAGGQPARSVFAAVNTRSMVVRWPYKLIADLRYGVSELYDLQGDPGEITNLAGRDPRRTSELRGELAAWVDQLGQSAAGNAALARGRLGDRRALGELIALARNPGLAPATRTQAIDVLAGFDDRAAIAPLAPLLHDAHRDIADRAAMALGASGDRRALPRLRDAVVRDEPWTRGLAGIALARAGDVAAVPALIELLTSRDEPARLDAIDALGSLRAREAVEALLDAYRDDHVRYRVVLALGQIAEPQTLALLLDSAAHDRSDEVRANATAALAMTGERSAIERMARLALIDPIQRYAASALGRIGALGRELAGWDARFAVHGDWLGCTAITDGPVWRYLGAKSCAAEASVRVPMRVRTSTRVRTLIVRARGAGPLTVSAEGVEIASLPGEDGRWQEWRIVLAPGAIAAPVDALTIRGPGRFEIAHVVLFDAAAGISGLR